jgi:hypothetical protein
MPLTFQEFADEQLHRAYPLVDTADGVDKTETFTLPTSLITDIFLCAPNIAGLDKTKFYIKTVVIRKFFIDIILGYADVTEPLGTFKNIRTDAPLHTTYDFSPSKIQANNDFTPLFFMTGQIMIGDATEAVRSLGAYSFFPANTAITPIRISLGVLNVQYISINGRLFTGVVKLREGANVSLDVETNTLLNGDIETVITISASLNPDDQLQLSNDQDVLDALVDQYGVPIQTINGIYPDIDRNFTLLGGDCTTITPGLNNVTISNPCATPCCNAEESITAILESLSNLNQRYANLINFFNAQSAAINDLQNKLLVLGSEIV